MCGGRSIEMNIMRHKEYLQSEWRFVGMPETRTKNARYDMYRDHCRLSLLVTYKICSKFYPVQVGRIILL